jgi:hypothetical protein
MSSHYCKLCNAEFDKKWKLTRHRNGKLGCKYEDDDYNDNSQNNKYTKNFETLIDYYCKCEKCGQEFTHRRSLYRHDKEGRCPEDSKKISKKVIHTMNQLMKNMIDEAPIIHNTIVTTENNHIPNNISRHGNSNIPPNTTTIITNNILNNTGVINNNSNNNININNGTINNNTIFQINAFGCENTDFLTFADKLEILKSKHMACIKILKIVYSRIENKNFFKVNKNNNNVSYLCENLDIGIFQEHQFRIEMFKNSTTLLYSIMLDCKDKLEFEEQLEMMDNITNIKNDVYSEIFNNGLSNFRKEIEEQNLDTETKLELTWGLFNIIDQELTNNNDNNRRRICKFVKDVNKNEDLKALHIANVNKAYIRKQKISNELEDAYIDNTKIDEIYGKIDYGQLAKELQLCFYQDTKFAKDLTERQKQEIANIKTQNTLGKLLSYSEINHERQKQINNIMNYEQDIEKLKELSNVD